MIIKCFYLLQPERISPADNRLSQRAPRASQREQQPLGVAGENYGPSARPPGHPALYPSPYDDPYFYYGTTEAGMNQGPSVGAPQIQGPAYGGTGGTGFGDVGLMSGE